jgi:hypothetical protein
MWGALSNERMGLSFVRVTVSSNKSLANMIQQLSFLSSFYSPGIDRVENVFYIIACSLVTVETCPQSRSLATAVVMSPIYKVSIWQCVYVSEY